MTSLAILGSRPAFQEPLHVGRPNTGDRDLLLAHINGMLDRGWFTNDGPLVQEFERQIAELVAVKHCVAMCNATVALEIAIRALDLKGEVIIPSFTFAATAHALQWQELTPVFVDIDPETHNLDPDRIEALITPRTSGILGVHLWGRPCDADAIERVANRHGLKVLYDAAHALNCSYKGRMIGGLGSCEVFSFHATKFVNSFEGGAVVTNDDVLAKKLRLMRNFGFDGYDLVIYLGINGKMTEVSAAMGLTSLSAIDQIVAQNRSNYECYRRGFQELPGVSLIEYNPNERNNYHYVVLEVDPQTLPLNRDELVCVLQAENVLARKYFWPGCHRMEPYRSLQPGAGSLLPETERIAERVLVLPTGQAVSSSAIETICQIVRTACSRADEVRSRLAASNSSPGFRQQSEP